MLVLISNPPLHNMFTKFLSAQQVVVAEDATAEISRRAHNLAQVYTTLKQLESCVVACEMLADELGPETYTHPLHEHINECIVACEQLTGAMVRQSRFCIQYAEVCVAACANLADECVHAEAVTALQCADCCGDAIDLIRSDFTVALSN